ncbi:MAG: hypothetical protein ACLFTK_15360 [Anaerolineales bacterium]
MFVHRLIRFVLLVALFGLVLPLAAQDDDTEMMRVEHEDIMFEYPASLALGTEIIEEEAVPLGEGDSGIPYWAATPAYTEIFFAEYAAGTDFFHEPRIVVYNTADFEAFDTGDYGITTQYEALQTLLENQPDLESFTAPSTLSDEALPFLPLFNAAQVFRAQPEFIEFQDGIGVRYLTYFSQAVNPIVDTEIFYTFQGLSNDGETYVAAILPVRTGLFPTEIDFESFDFETFADDYLTYLDETQIALTEQAAEDFDPMLTTLDEMIASIDTTLEE